MEKIAAELPSKRQFSAALNSIFRARVGEVEEFDICLVGFDEMISNEVQENFSLLFRASVETPPSQGIYHLTHEALGSMDLFLVPIKKDDSGLYFEAVFNLIKAVNA